jgi:hypothetical protein
MLLASSLFAIEQPVIPLRQGELLSNEEYAVNGNFQQGSAENTIESTPAGWVLERSTGETKGNWQTPNTTVLQKYIYVRRGITSISQTDMRIVEAKPPLHDDKHDGYSLAPFPWSIWGEINTPSSALPIAVRQGEASQTLPVSFDLSVNGGLILQCDAWAPDHRNILADLATTQPAIYLTIDLICDDKSITDSAQIRVPITLPYEKWQRATVRLDWTNGHGANRIWLEWRVFDDRGNLIYPDYKAAKNHNSLLKEGEPKNYDLPIRKDQMPFGSSIAIRRDSPVYKLLQANNFKVFPKIIVGSWFATESSYGSYFGSGEVYIDNVSLRQIRNHNAQR